jgi:Tol biopolymer transport system component
MGKSQGNTGKTVQTSIDRGEAVTARKRGSAFVAALFLAVLGVLACASISSAKDLYLYEFEKSFNGADSNPGPMTSHLQRVSVNNETGNVYVLDEHNGKGDITQYNQNGEAEFWSALGGTNSIEFETGLYTLGSSESDMAFDNATGHHWGLFVYNQFPGGYIRAWNPDGTVRLPGFPQSSSAICGLGFSRDNGLYVGGGQFTTKYNPQTGARIEPGLMGSPFSEGGACHTVWDLENEAWLPEDGEHIAGEPGLNKYGTPEEDNFGYPNFAKPKIVVQPRPGGSSIKRTEMADIDESTDTIFAIEDGKEHDGEAQVLEASHQGQPMLNFGSGTIHQSTGIAVNSNNHKVYVTSKTPTPRVDIFKRNPTPVTIPDAETLPGDHPTGTSGTLRAEVDPAGGGTTTDCRFDWGPNTKYTFGTLPCKVGGVETNTISSPSEVTNGITSLTLGNQYHYRVATRNANGYWSFGADQLFEASTSPTSTPLLVEKINTDSGTFQATVSPHGGTTSYQFEIGTQECSLGGCEVVEGGEGKLASRLTAQQLQVTALHLQPNTLYHVRLVAANQAGEVGPELEFRTYPAPPEDNCPNKGVRQQTSASLLSDCRAYELVSAANTGGYDVESDLVPLQTPFAAYPNAHDRMLYGLHFGSIPNIAGSPPNYGLDPYVAERTENGWVTRYVGIPGEGLPDDEAYGSPLLGSDEQLDSFAFGGPGICDPCFEGLGPNLPLRLHGGPVEPGMVGSEDPGESEPEGEVAKYLSSDGSHLVFGSSKEFEGDGNGETLRIYERDLNGGGTEIVSTDENGETLLGGGVSSLDLSSDGSRVLVGKEVSEEGDNVYNQLYLHLAGDPSSLKLTEGVPDGAIFDGMTADGSRVFYTTKDNLAGDTDESADIFEVEIAFNGTASTPRLISTMADGTPSNDDSCSPPGSPDNWNAVSGEGKCNAVAPAGGAGVAANAGTFYFFSPEQLDGGAGTADQPNLYVVEPGGHPHFVATVDSSEGKPTELAPERPLVTADLTSSSLSNPSSVAVDQSNGDIYVDQSGSGKITRFTSAGAAHNFTAGTGAGTNEMSESIFSTTETQIAVDSSSSPLSGDLYVAPNSGEIHVYAPTGASAGALTGFGEACGVAVDQATGDVYVGDYAQAAIWKFHPKPTAAAPLENGDYEKTGVHTTGTSPCFVAVDTAGHAYAMQYSEGPVKEFDTSLFTAAAPGNSGTIVANEGKAISTDPTTNHLFVTLGSGIAEYLPNGELFQKFGSSNSGGSRGVAINGTNHHVYVPNSGHLVEFGYKTVPVVLIDNPAVVHGVLESGKRRWSDFQITPDGRYAVFASGRSLTGYPTLGNLEIYRYDTQGDALECASCGTTLAPSKTSTTLSDYGLNMTDDGRVFFTSREGLVLSDTNEKLDAYQWNGGLEVNKVSTGRSSYDSKLLSVSADGTDAFFFTRDVLVGSDENGGAVKIYDARTDGGYLEGAERRLCAASDECHGPGTPQPPPPNINSITGAGSEAPEEEKKCRKGFVKRHHRCVKKHRRHRKHHRHARHKHHGTAGNG